MGKFLDSIKGFFNENFLKEVTCSHCGKKDKIMCFDELKDGSLLCADCAFEIPKEFNFKPEEKTLEEYREIRDFVDNANKNFEPIFTENDDFSYGKFKVDTQHNLCRIGNSFIFEISNISTYSIDFHAEDLKDGLLSTKAKGDVRLAFLFLEKPYASFMSKTIKSNVKVKVETHLFSRTVTYSNPPELDVFLARFHDLHERLRSEKAANKTVE